MIKITLHGEPRSTSHIYKFASFGGRGVRGYVSAQGKALKESYAWDAKSQYRGTPLIGEVEVRMALFFGTKRKADVDNFNKLAFDALTGIVWEDDSQIYKLTITKHYDKENPRIELEVRGI